MRRPGGGRRRCKPKVRRRGLSHGAGQRVQRKTKKPLVQRYTLLKRTLTGKARNGPEVKAIIKIGVIGFTTPGIMN